MTGEHGDGKILLFIPGGVSVHTVHTFAEGTRGEPFLAC